MRYNNSRVLIKSLRLNRDDPRITESKYFRIRQRGCWFVAQCGKDLAKMSFVSVARVLRRFAFVERWRLFGRYLMVNSKFPAYLSILGRNTNFKMPLSNSCVVFVSREANMPAVIIGYIVDHYIIPTNRCSNTLYGDDLLRRRICSRIAGGVCDSLHEKRFCMHE